jgi:lysophospholipase L1-like esterase
MIFQTQQKVVFIGDSITDCDRRGASAPYGNGYVSMVRNFITARYPQQQLTFVNKGIGGNTVRDLAQRWEQDVIAERPDWLSVMIGINDVWRHFGGNASEAVPLDEYQSTLRRLLKRTKEATTAHIILAEPYMIEPNKMQPMRKLMDLYGATLRGLAKEFDAKVVPTQEAYDEALKFTSATFWADDQIHPNAPGHAIIAQAFLRVFEFAL